MMRCPNCEKDLLMTERAGIEIDYCPGCRGVWLDRGELDKFIERAGREAAQPIAYPAVEPPHHGSAPYQTLPGLEDRSRYRPDESGHSKYGYGKKRESFLSKLFDFD